MKNAVVILVLCGLNYFTFGQLTPTGFLPKVSTVISGEISYATTAFVEQFWRLPGNQGFDTSIYYVQKQLERAGFRPEAQGHGRLTYRLERRPLHRPAWEPVDAMLTVAGESAPLLQFKTNRNMMTIHSFSTPAEGIEGEVVFVPNGDFSQVDTLNLKGKIILSDIHAYNLLETGVLKYGALGGLAYHIPDFNRPEKHVNAIPFTGIKYLPHLKPWILNLSTAAFRYLQKKSSELKPFKVRVQITTSYREADELTLIAEVHGHEHPHQRMVYSAHVQEPGANDNASGVGTLTEMAMAAARLYQSGRINPRRTLTFIWGDEISSTARYISEDTVRAKGISWGMSLDMTGENTAITGGSFLIEKMPDPSAVWTRGKDKHTEWGSTTVELKDLRPHYFNDLMVTIAESHGRKVGWAVNTNPFEGGSDHQPFLDAGIPGLLLWHFTDEFYHTDQDRLDKVSATEMRHVAITALSCGLYLTSAQAGDLKYLHKVILKKGKERITMEKKLAQQNIASGGDSGQEKIILQAWADWYTGAVKSSADVLDPITVLTANHQRLEKRATKKIQQWLK